MEENNVTIEDFAKEFRKLYDMSHHIKGITSIDWSLKYHGWSNATELIAAHVNHEIAESNLKLLLGKEVE